MSPSAWALRHPVPVAVITAGALLFGLLALGSLNREFIPPMVMPTAAVLTLWPGAGAEDVERDITSVLEDRFASVAGLTDLSSESREGVSLIRIRFAEDTDIDAMLQELRTRVDRAVGDLPDDIVADPDVSAWGSSDLPVFSFAVSGPWSLDEMTRYTDDVVIPELYRVDGVARAEILGGRTKEIRIRLDVDAMAAAGVAPSDVYGALQGRNLALPAGLVDWGGGRWAYRVTGEFASREELDNLVVGLSAAGPIRLSRIADIAEVDEESDERVRADGGDLAVVQITKRENGNAIRMSRDIRRRLDRLESESAGYRFLVLNDDAETVRLSLSAVIRSALTGIAMAVLVIWIFLRRLSSTLVVAASLPIGLVIAFAGMRLAGQSVNVLTLTGITVSLGMVVDASIVVLENIHRRRAAGDGPETAAAEGAGEVAGAVLASITTSVCVFIPMIFLTGLIGKVMKDLSLTLVLCLGASLFAALFLVPPLAHRGLVRATYREAPLKRFRFMRRVERSYRRSLSGSTKMSGVVIATAAAVLVMSVLAADLLGLSFIPAADYGELFVSLDLPPGSSLEDSTAAADRVDAVLAADYPEISDAIWFVGMEDELSGDARRREAVWGQILLTASNRRDRGFRELIDQLNDRLPGVVPGAAVTVFNGGFDRMVSMGADGAGYRVELSSESWDELRSAARRVEAILDADPEIRSSERDVTEDRRTITADLDGEALDRLGVSASEAAVTARIAWEGIDAGDYRPTDGPDRPIRLTTNLEQTAPGPGTLGRLSVRSASGAMVAFDSVADIREDLGVSGIRRRDRARTLTVVGYARGENIRDISRRLRAALDEQPLEGDVDWSLKGVGGLVNDSLADLGLVLLVSLFLVYAVMAIQFERLLQPLIIMASVPFCFIGVVGGLAAFGSDLSIISFLGIVALGGIVVNNAIVLVDRINRLRRDGLGLDEAVVTGAVTRLRPILMTTLTTFFGVLPLAFARGTGARIYAPLGQAIAGGLITSTLVTLFLIPVLYRLVEGRRAARQTRAAAAPEAVNHGAA